MSVSIRNTDLEKINYVRDGRSPIPKNASVSKVMSKNRSKGTKPELALRRFLFQNGIRGYRLNWKKAPGKPDIAFPGRKIAIFVHGCFWHHCPKCNNGYPVDTPDLNGHF